jgi:8-oxo-dGTP pyrophosphatase MutT (NUDIX family)
MMRTEADLRGRVGRLLAMEPHDWNRSDEDMNQRSRMLPESLVPKPAAVLVPLVTRNSGLSVLLTQRTETLSKHPGQIAFPGGRIDQHETAIDAALREAEEEVALHRSFVEPLGFLDGYLTVTGYLVKPVVALVREGHSIEKQAAEVADVFEVPLDFLMNMENLRVDSREFKGVQRHFYVFPFGERYIWGATAGMLKSLYDRLYA